MHNGCCSAIFPCSHQQRSPDTICDNCTRASYVGLAMNIEAAKTVYLSHTNPGECRPLEQLGPDEQATIAKALRAFAYAALSPS
jgi:hypothetical protein